MATVIAVIAMATVIAVIAMATVIVIAMATVIAVIAMATVIAVIAMATVIAVSELDASMQELVNENYTKFITATDTVQELKGKMESMDTELAGLQEKMDHIDGLSNAIDAQLAPNRADIHSLATASDGLAKLVFLLRLPARVRKALDLAAYASAISSFVRYMPVLEAHADMPRIGAVLAAMRLLAEETKSALRAQLARASSMDELGSVMDMLMDMGESVDNLRASYLEKQKEALDARLERLIASLPDIPTREPGDPPPLAAYPLPDALDTLHSGFLPPLLEFAAAYRALFLHKHNAAGAGSHGLVHVARSVLVPFFTTLKALISQYVPTGVLLEALDKIADDMAVLARRLPEAAIDDRVDEVFSKALHAHLDGVFSKLRASLLNAVDAAARSLVPLTDPDAYRPALDSALASISAALASSLSSLRPLLGASHPGIRDNVALITSSAQVNIQQALLFIADGVRSRAAAAASSSALAALAALATALADDLLPSFIDRVLAVLSVPVHAAMLAASPLADDLRATATSLAARFVDMTAWELSLPWLAVVADPAAAPWLVTDDDPLGPSPLAAAVVSRCAAAAALAAAAFPDNAPTLADRAADGELVDSLAPSPAGPGRGRAASDSHRRAASAFESMTLMFEETLKIGALHLELRASSVMLGILARFTKAWVEVVRQLALSRGAVRQLQLDIALLAAAAPAWIDDGRLIAALFRDVQLSAQARSRDATLLTADDLAVLLG
ncbi:hypothetical protein, variant [Thecamonas trahens ATCC 50062]|uniref:Vacuolar protein sorting-associated protein 51 homolog n=1 Tax=Thecamonas trahens ATCC 50062 TaxID=461836 RepID=A0A0L0DY55_THETB|nr:hypothetical protein, variant [Thecamonas trahens ATCC 50062]KNC56488.1 hypothetical protein, variant [Thecamonas trahens ATCC 50062]|eukprot:XP_013752633.1 hypothetical protein, variant [Thecamonas trahens ATCC 50062]